MSPYRLPRAAGPLLQRPLCRVASFLKATLHLAVEAEQAATQCNQNGTISFKVEAQRGLQNPRERLFPSSSVGNQLNFATHTLRNVKPHAALGIFSQAGRRFGNRSRSNVSAAMAMFCSRFSAYIPGRYRWLKSAPITGSNFLETSSHRATPARPPRSANVKSMLWGCRARASEATSPPSSWVGIQLERLVDDPLRRHFTSDVGMPEPESLNWCRVSVPRVTRC